MRDVNNGIVVLQDGDEMLIHCRRCGLSCSIPPELPARAIDDFYRDHRLEIPVEAHPTECPAWAVRSVLHAT